ncbi:unnamed protein product, partial [Closterium sp. Yama58-4]
HTSGPEQAVWSRGEGGREGGIVNWVSRLSPRGIPPRHLHPPPPLLGFSLLYSDIDIAFLHNPLPFFKKPDPNNI